MSIDSKTGRIGDWFQSLKGRKLYPFDPRPEDVDVEEIAHALSNIGRFGGHARVFYSVAQHSVHVLECVGRGHPCALAALLHDAAETYLGDVIRPIKRGGGLAAAWLEAEIAWNRAIGEALGVDQTLINSPEVKRADDRVLLAERRDLLAPPPEGWRERDYPPWEGSVYPWSPAYARQEFLREFRGLKERER